MTVSGSSTNAVNTTERSPKKKKKGNICFPWYQKGFHPEKTDTDLKTVLSGLFSIILFLSNSTSLHSGIFFFEMERAFSCREPLEI